MVKRLIHYIYVEEYKSLKVNKFDFLITRMPCLRNSILKDVELLICKLDNLISKDSSATLLSVECVVDDERTYIITVNLTGWEV